MNRSGRSNSTGQSPQSSNILTVLKGSLTNPFILTVVIPSIIGFSTALFANVFAPRVGIVLASNSVILMILSLSTFWGVCFLCSFWNSARIWMNQENYFREAYSLSASYSIIYLTTIIILGILSQIMPWTLFSIILEYLEKENLTLNFETHPFEYLSLILIFVLRLITYLDAYDRGKNFKKSEQRYQQEKRSTKISFLEEGWQEFQRRITQSYQLVPHEDLITETIISDESWTFVLDSAWEKRAKQLYEQSYRQHDLFNNENAWHNSPGCWIGYNYKQNLFVLVPAQSSLSKEQQQTFINYAQERSEDSKTHKIEEIIFAFPTEDDERKTEKITEEKRGFLYNLTLNLLGKDETIDIIYSVSQTHEVQ